MSVVVVQREKENFLKMYRQYMNCMNNTKILDGSRENAYFRSIKKIKKEKKKKAYRAVLINSKKIKLKKRVKISK
jgi:hypothetical protein